MSQIAAATEEDNDAVEILSRPLHQVKLGRRLWLIAQAYHYYHCRQSGALGVKLDMLAII